MLRNAMVLTLLGVLLGGCDSADAVSSRLIVVDTHIDLPYRLDQKYENVGEFTSTGEFDYVRARKGGLSAAFMSIYVPVELQEPGVAKDYADYLIDLVRSTASRNEEKFVIVQSTKDVLQASSSERVALALGIENGAAIETDLTNVRYFYNRGVRYITLAHAKSNLISDSSYDDHRRWGGLSNFGVQVVEEMNRVGIIVDVSHLTDDAIHDVLDVSEAPVLASHSSARSFTPGFERNLSDELITKIAENGGVIQVNFGSVFLTQEANEWYARFSDQRTAYREQNGLPESDPVSEFETTYREEHPLPYATLDDVLDHIDHIVELVGVQHVGFGSDFDGVGDSLPVGLKSVADYPSLIEGLRARGYTDDEVRMIAGHNTLRVWTIVEDHARVVRLLAKHRDSNRYFSHHQ